ncbi:hypothetical protein M097_2782 [Phocaeicola vulgatus str. 3775 SL(B) 10 (iv)]|uniref:Uncharacterized protein n=1 Tax=Phocaeicola vulgatus str. 3775 SL(B) 10 (iv) TaxID=1339350 RepID=A0A078R2Q6_PHOVU|nr:hypothetical protein M098_2130 [Phocaeicola vulgatus str. 3775 SR(B) 19]KDS29640.1 hypothetical protein M097_2782 [Phocaeicola vulgatus str. 3775 SL(B) 10 (iv)]
MAEGLPLEIPSARLWKLQFLVVRDVFVEVHFLWCFYACWK